MPGKKGVTKAEAKADSQPEKTTEPQEEKAPEVQKEEPTVDKVEETKNLDKRGRGRPKKNDSNEPTTKKTKKVKERNPPSRVSKRVANMKTGVTAPVVEEEPKKKDASTKKPHPKVQEEKKELSASNGATEQAVES